MEIIIGITLLIGLKIFILNNIIINSNIKNKLDYEYNNYIIFLNNNYFLLRIYILRTTTIFTIFYFLYDLNTMEEKWIIVLFLLLNIYNENKKYKLYQMIKSNLNDKYEKELFKEEFLNVSIKDIKEEDLKLKIKNIIKNSLNSTSWFKIWDKEIFLLITTAYIYSNKLS